MCSVAPAGFEATSAKPRMTFRWDASVTGTKHNQITPSELHFA